jgi:hypothetical protein
MAVPHTCNATSILLWLLHKFKADTRQCSRDAQGAARWEVWHSVTQASRWRRVTCVENDTQNSRTVTNCQRNVITSGSVKHETQRRDYRHSTRSKNVNAAENAFRRNPGKSVQQAARQQVGWHCTLWELCHCRDCIIALPNPTSFKSSFLRTVIAVQGFQTYTGVEGWQFQTCWKYFVNPWQCLKRRWFYV